MAVPLGLRSVLKGSGEAPQELLDLPDTPTSLAGFAKEAAITDWDYTQNIELSDEMPIEPLEIEPLRSSEGILNSPNPLNDSKTGLYFRQLHLDALSNEQILDRLVN